MVGRNVINSQQQETLPVRLQVLSQIYMTISSSTALAADHIERFTSMNPSTAYPIRHLYKPSEQNAPNTNKIPRNINIQLCTYTRRPSEHWRAPVCLIIAPDPLRSIHEAKRFGRQWEGFSARDIAYYHYHPSRFVRLVCGKGDWYWRCKKNTVRRTNADLVTHEGSPKDAFELMYKQSW